MPEKGVVAISASHGDTAECVTLAVRVFPSELEIPLLVGIGRVGDIHVAGKGVPVENVLHVFADLHFHVVEGEQSEGGHSPFVGKT